MSWIIIFVLMFMLRPSDIFYLFGWRKPTDSWMTIHDKSQFLWCWSNVQNKQLHLSCCQFVKHSAFIVIFWSLFIEPIQAFKTQAFFPASVIVVFSFCHACSHLLWYNFYCKYVHYHFISVFRPAPHVHGVSVFQRWTPDVTVLVHLYISFQRYFIIKMLNKQCGLSVFTSSLFVLSSSLGLQYCMPCRAKQILFYEKCNLLFFHYFRGKGKKEQPSQFNLLFSAIHNITRWVDCFCSVFLPVWPRPNKTVTFTMSSDVQQHE